MSDLRRHIAPLVAIALFGAFLLSTLPVSAKPEAALSQSVEPSVEQGLSVQNYDEPHVLEAGSDCLDRRR